MNSHLKSQMRHAMMLLWLWLCSTSLAYSNELISIEYQFNGGPSSTVSAIAGAPITKMINDNVDIASLGTGNHLLEFRVTDSANNVSDWISMRFVVNALDIGVSNSIAEAEFYLNSDPGTGNGNSISYSTDPSSPVTIIETTVNVSAANNTQNRFGFRVKDLRGNWSNNNEQNFTLVDTDGDGVEDGSDAFPNDISASIDTDLDGYPDSWNIGFSEADSTTGLHLDAFPNDIAASLDDDGDSHPDDWNEGYTQMDSTTGLTLDMFPLDVTEWDDFDGDSIGDNADPDDDNDGMPDVYELDKGFDPFDASDAGIDTDGDGFSNLQEFDANTDPLDANSFPVADTTKGDVDNDGLADFIYWNAVQSNWRQRLSSTQQSSNVSLSTTSTLARPIDVDSDGIEDAVVIDMGTNTLHSVGSIDKTEVLRSFSVNSGMPFVGQVDQVSITDIVSFSTDGYWSFDTGTTDVPEQRLFSLLPSDRAMVTDLDKDGLLDLGVWVNSLGRFYVLRSSDSSVLQMNLNNPGQGYPLSADFDGDSIVDLGIFNADNNEWVIHMSLTGATSVQVFGNSGAVPVPLDYDGDGKADVAVYQPDIGTWDILYSETGEVMQVQDADAQAGDYPAYAIVDAETAFNFSSDEKSVAGWKDATSKEAFMVQTMSYSSFIQQANGTEQPNQSTGAAESTNVVDNESRTGGSIAWLLGLMLAARVWGAKRAKLAYIALLFGVLPQAGVAETLSSNGVQINHTPETTFATNARPLITVDIESQSEVGIARVYFKSPAMTHHLFVVLSEEEKGRYSARLPKPDDTFALEYIILFKTNDGGVFKTQPYYVPVEEIDGMIANVAGTIQVFTELDEAPEEINGFTDSLVLDVAESSTKYGLVAGLYEAGGASSAAAANVSNVTTLSASQTGTVATSATSSTATAAGTSTSATTAATTAATGISTTAVVAGVAVAGVAAAAGGGGGGDSEPAPVEEPPPSPPPAPTPRADLIGNITVSVRHTVCTLSVGLQAQYNIDFASSQATFSGETLTWTPNQSQVDGNSCAETSLTLGTQSYDELANMGLDISNDGPTNDNFLNFMSAVAQSLVPGGATIGSVASTGDIDSGELTLEVDNDFLTLFWNR